MAEKKPIIIKLEHGNTAQKSNEDVKIDRISSSISPYNFIRLIGVTDNKINPRAARENGITADIRETLEKSPNLFWLMSKGILIATENCKILDRGRISLTTDGDREGIMDGGHNVLAIAQYIVGELFDDIKIFKTWADCKLFWKENEQEIIRRFNDRGGNDAFPFSIPVEIIYPSNVDGGIETYYQSISQICTARNTNVQLRQTTQDNQVGIYDVLKQHISNSDKVIWKSGEAGTLKVEDIISMAVLPLIVLQEQKYLPDELKSLNPVSVYAQKSKCVDFFGDVLRHPAISEKIEDKYILKNKLVRSALEMTDDILRACDKLYAVFPEIYNNPTGDTPSGKFGKISCVEQKKKYPMPFRTTTAKSDYNYPMAFFLPLFCGIRQLMYVDEATGTLRWRVNPASPTFDFRSLKCFKYVELIKFLDYNPQKVGKANMMYLEGADIFSLVH